jgi:hypothetical protein
MKFSLLQLFSIFPELFSHFSLYVMRKLLSIFKLPHNLLLGSNVFKISSIMFFFFILLLPLAKASVVLNATANITSSGTMFYVGANGNGWVGL